MSICNRMIVLNLLAIVIIGFSACTTGKMLTSTSEKHAEDEVQSKNLDIFLLIGQSNMAGRAEIEEQDKDTLDQVYLYTGLTDHPWERAANPLNKYSSIRKDISMQRLNPGYTFAREMARHSDHDIGLVVNARGGTSINLWVPGTEYYNEAVSRTKDALKSGRLMGVLWHQGESDVSRYDTYLDKIILLIEALRKEFNDPDLPVVVGQLSEDKEPRIKFNKMILELPERLTDVAVVTSQHTSTFDSTHFDSPSQRLMGERYAREMINLIKE